MRRYPHVEWLDAAVDALDPAFDESAEVLAYVATHDEDYPTISRAHFIQDLHRIARIATDQSTDPEVGYIVRTTTRGLRADQVAFTYYRVARHEARGTDAVTPKRPTQPQGPPRATVDPTTGERVFPAPPPVPSSPQQPQPTEIHGTLTGRVPRPEPVNAPADKPSPWCNGGPTSTLGYHRTGSPLPGGAVCPLCGPALPPPPSSPTYAAPFPGPQS